MLADYRSFTSPFVRDQRIKALVQARLDSAAQWPSPWVRLNPSFDPGGSFARLVQEGLLHSECERIIRIKPDPERLAGSGMTLHRDRVDEIRAAQSGYSSVLTAGTGSGRSLA